MPTFCGSFRVSEASALNRMLRVRRAGHNPVGLGKPMRWKTAVVLEFRAGNITAWSRQPDQAGWPPWCPEFPTWDSSSRRIAWGNPYLQGSVHTPYAYRAVTGVSSLRNPRNLRFPDAASPPVFMPRPWWFWRLCLRWSSLLWIQALAGYPVTS